MAKPQNKTLQTDRRRSTSFLACFGFSDDDELPPKKSTSRKNKSSLSLSGAILRLSSKKPRSKTVPLYNTGKAEDANCKTQTSKKKSHKNSDDQSQSSAAAVSNHAAAKEKPKETRSKNIFLGNRKVLDPTRTGSSQPGSPKNKAKLTHTVSLPVLEGKTRVDNPRVHAPVDLKELRLNNNVALVGKLDPNIVGISIIMVTLIIMLIWGRLCAILCTSACFYFSHRFRTADDKQRILNNDMDSNHLNLNLKEYKKKVVLEGLLKRNH